MALNQVQVGPQSVNDYSQIIARAGKQGDQIVSELHGRYYESTYRGNMYGITGGLTTTTAAGAATFTGLAVGNPAGSGYNLVLNKCWVSQGAALTAETEIGIMYGAGSITASLATVFNRKSGGAASITTATAGQTITAPTAFIPWCGSGSGAITVPGVIPFNGVDFEGSVIIPPGNFFASYTSRVTTTALVFTFNWEEVPV